MGCVVEMAFWISSRAACEWNGNPARKSASSRKDPVDAKLVRILAALPDMTRVRHDGGPVTTGLVRQRAAIIGCRLAACLLKRHRRNRRVTASHSVPYSPGVTIRETPFHLELDTPDLADVPFDTAPSAFILAFEAAGKPERVATLTASRRRFRGRGRARFAVDVALDRLDAGPDSTAPCRYELRLTTGWVRKTRTTPRCLRCSRRRAYCSTALPAFPVLTDIADRLCRGWFCA